MRVSEDEDAAVDRLGGVAMKIETETPMRIVGVVKRDEPGDPWGRWFVQLREGFNEVGKGLLVHSEYRGSDRQWELPLKNEAEAKSFGERIGQWL